MPSRVLILIKSESNSATHGHGVEQQSPRLDRGIVYRPAEGEFYLAGGELGDDVAGVRQRPG